MPPSVRRVTPTSHSLSVKLASAGNLELTKATALETELRKRAAAFAELVAESIQSRAWTGLLWRGLPYSTISWVWSADLLLAPSSVTLLRSSQPTHRHGEFREARLSHAGGIHGEGNPLDS